MTPTLPSLTSAKHRASKTVDSIGAAGGKLDFVEGRENTVEVLAGLPVRVGHPHNDIRSMASVPTSSQTPTTNKKLFALVLALGLASVVWLVVIPGMRYGFSNPWAWQL